ncbi:MAG: dTMP kinase [Gemmatimonadales bacterium]|nr:dTMP kinase [Gemmatimonadales bacterium]
MTRGCFVVLEGPEGAGKTTLAASLVTRMRRDGLEVVSIREPGGTPVAEALRRELLDADREWTPEAELLYMATARADLVTRVIKPALAAGQVVLSDRYDLSTMAYQGAGRGLPMEQVRWVNGAATGGLVPDITLVLDLDPAVGRARQAAAGKGADRMERESEAFHERVAAAYVAAEGPGVHHLEAGASPEAVLEAAWRQLHAVRPDRFQADVS